MLSIYAGLRVGEIAALTIGDVATQSGDVRREIKTRSTSDEGVEGSDRRPIRAGSERDRRIRENAAHSSPRSGPYCIAAKRSPLHQRHVVHGVQNNLRDRRHSNLFALWPPNLRDPLNAKGVGMRTIQKLMSHRHIGTTALYCEVSEEIMRNAVDLV